METKFYECPICGNVIVKCVDSGVIPTCCGKEMVELKCKNIEEKQEAHLPVVERTTEDTVKCSCDPFYLSHYNRRYHTKVSIGSTPHPMSEKHRICFIYYETENGGQIRYLSPDSPAEACFYSTDKPIAIYSFCNIHGLWKICIVD
ncbi:MAG: hypothetical protein MJZ41_10360 [Bacteroidaceae bacterium]|nr:hypothetical protein [Bacteroidaceae bacterium]